MDARLTKTLADCIAHLEGGATVDDCLQRHSAEGDNLRSQLELWQAMRAARLVQPPTGAFNSARQALLSSLSQTPPGFSPLAAARAAPAWATVTSAIIAVMVLLGGGAGASAALGGPNPAGHALSAVGVDSSAHSATHSNDCAADLTPSADASGQEACEDDNRGHGNDADNDDDDNPGQGGGNHGAGKDETDCLEGDQACEDANKGHGNDADRNDEDNPGQGNGNLGTNDGGQNPSPSPKPNSGDSDGTGNPGNTGDNGNSKPND